MNSNNSSSSNSNGNNNDMSETFSGCIITNHDFHVFLFRNFISHSSPTCKLHF